MDYLTTLDRIEVQLKKQLNSFFVFNDFSGIEESIKEAYERCLVALSATNNKYLCPNGIPQFSLEHSGCWSVFLYYLSNCLTKRPGGGQTANQIYYLNKILHSVDWYCEIGLPDHFMVEHPLGSVLGRAVYGDFLFLYQGVTIGGNVSLGEDAICYPVLGDYVLLYSNAKVLGNSHIGNNVIIAADASIINEDIPDNSIVFGRSPNLVIKNDAEKILKQMRRIWRTI